MEIDILFKSDKLKSDIFKKMHDDWYLAATDQDTYKYVFKNIRGLCDDCLQGIIIKLRNFKYNDPKILWSNTCVDKIIAIANPGGDNLTNWLSNTLDINGIDSTSIIDNTKDMGVWIDESDMSIVIDVWKDREIKSDDDFKTILEMIKCGLEDRGVISTNDAMNIIRQYNQMSNDITSSFATSSIKDIYDIAKENFDCKIIILKDTLDVTNPDTDTVAKEVKDKLWKILVDNRGKLQCLKFNVDTTNNDIEIYEVGVYKDNPNKLQLSNVIIYNCKIHDAILDHCIMFKSTFEKCTFKDCETLGVRVVLKDCKDYKDNINGKYTIEGKDDKKKDDDKED